MNLSVGLHGNCQGVDTRDNKGRAIVPLEIKALLKGLY
jgi:hypothetical protein